MAFREEEIKRLQALSDEMVKLIEDSATSSEASVAFGKIGRVCARAIADNAAAAAKRMTRAESVKRFQAARQARAGKKGGASAQNLNAGQAAQGSQGQRRAG